jgi:acetylornithine/N-succinyldiaminopimelate aminotransferase
VDALTMQGSKLWHVSNIFTIPEQEKLAEKLCEVSFADVCFMTNSGTEAVECALKTARKYHAANGAPERIDVIGFEGSFHGRSYAAVNASGNAGYLDGFGPQLPGYVHLPFGDHEALKAAAKSPTAAAIIVEPVQGEGGARSLPTECLRGRTSCAWPRRWAAAFPSAPASPPPRPPRAWWPEPMAPPTAATPWRWPSDRRPLVNW